MTKAELAQVAGGDSGDAGAATAKGAISVEVAGAITEVQEGGIAASFEAPIGGALGCIGGTIIGAAVGLGAYELGDLADSGLNS